jgi:hypothetical protein
MEEMKITDKTNYVDAIYKGAIIGILCYIAFMVNNVNKNVHQILHQNWHDNQAKQSNYSKQQELKDAILDKLLLQLSDVK